MTARESLLDYYKRWRDHALSKLVPGQYADTYRAAQADVAHYDKLIGKFE